MDEFVFEFGKELSENFGNHSLIGSLINAGWNCKTPVRLRFPQTSTNWRSTHNGPDLFIVAEYTPMCLVEDILYLRNMVPVEVESYEKDPQ